MGHCITIYLARTEDLLDPRIKKKELKAGISAVVDYPDEETLKRGRTVALVSTNYFGGFGDQQASVYEDGKLIYEGDTEMGAHCPINHALNMLGVKDTASDDEFDVVGLGNYRSNEDFEDNRVEPKEENSEPVNLINRKVANEEGFDFNSLLEDFVEDSYSEHRRGSNFYTKSIVEINAKWFPEVPRKYDGFWETNQYVKDDDHGYEKGEITELHRVVSMEKIVRTAEWVRVVKYTG